jgi:hypothetical protein
MVLGEPWYRVPFAPLRLDFRATGNSAALSIYRPHSRLARTLTPWNRRVMGGRFRLRVDRPPIPLATLPRDLAPPLDAASFRSSREKRWVTGLADADSLRYVLKSGSSEDHGLTNERQVLERLRSNRAFAVPCVAWTAQDRDHVLLATEGMQLDDGHPSIDEIADLCTALVRGDLGTPVVHGDLAPWNIARCGDRLAVWDFEKARTEAVEPLQDLVHYVMRAGALLGAWRALQAKSLLVDPGSPGERHAAAFRLAPADATVLVRRALQDNPTDVSEHELRYRRETLRALSR